MNKTDKLVLTAAATLFVINLVIVALGSKNRSLPPPEPLQWYDIESPFPGYTCKYHRNDLHHKGSESTVCVPTSTLPELRPVRLGVPNVVKESTDHERNASPGLIGKNKHD